MCNDILIKGVMNVPQILYLKRLIARSNMANSYIEVKINFIIVYFLSLKEFSIYIKNQFMADLKIEFFSYVII